MHALQRKAQLAGFLARAVETDLDWRQRPAISRLHVVDALQALGWHFACHLHDDFLLHQTGVLRELARHAPVLRVDHQTTGTGLQRYCGGELGKVPFEQAGA